MTRLKIGVVGLGNIAQKAYLPVYASLRSQVDFQLVNRGAAKLAQVADDYGMTAVGTDYHALLNAHVAAVMIHLPTALHEAAIRFFLSHDIHVYVDKPVTTDYATTAALYQLAAAHHVLLTAGFNRRFVPFVQTLAQVPEPGTVRAVKNEAAFLLPPRDVAYDLIIHPLDTALAVAGFPEGLTPQFSWHCDAQGRLTRAFVFASGPAGLIEAGSDLLSGADAETVAVTAPSGSYALSELTTLTVTKGNTRTVTAAPKWQNAGETRGFGPLVRAFLAAVRQAAPNPVPPASSLITHRWIEALVQHIELAQQQ